MGFSTKFLGESQEAPKKKLHVGYSLMKCIAFNPSDAEYEAMFKVKPQQPLTYTGTTSQGMRYARMVFYMESCDPNYPIHARYDIPLYECVNSSANTGKTQCIDKYGETAWVTADEFQLQSVPVSRTGRTLRIIPPYKACVQGEAQLVQFLKMLMGVRDPWTYKMGSWVKVDDAKMPEYEFSFDNINSVFTGNFNEIRNVVRLVKERMVWCLLGIHTNETNGEMYQCIYKQCDYPTSNTCNAIKRSYENDMAGGYVKDYYELTPVHEFTEERVPAWQNVPKNHDANMLQHVDDLPF